MKPELKKLLVLNLPYLLFVYLFAKCGQTYRLSAGADASAKLLHLTSGISAAFASPLPSLHPFDLCVGVVGAVAVRLIVYSKGKNAKKYRKGEEYGSARWGTAKDIAPYIDPKFENNILLTQTERLTMTGRPKDPKTARNKNVLVIGGSGSGKTRFYVKPNLMQCFPTSDYPISFVVTDPKGTLVLETGQMFQRAGYRVKILNTMLVDRDAKILRFQKEKYYTVGIHSGSLKADSGRIADAETANSLKEKCTGTTTVCTSVKREKKAEQPPKLYDLTTLQREANRLFGFTAKQTLDYAQQLYEKKLLTYPRTDSQYLTEDMGQTVQHLVSDLLRLLPIAQGLDLPPKVGRVLNSKKVSDHHAILPTAEFVKQGFTGLAESESKRLSMKLLTPNFTPSTPPTRNRPTVRTAAPARCRPKAWPMPSASITGWTRPSIPLAMWPGGVLAGNWPN